MLSCTEQQLEVNYLLISEKNIFCAVLPAVAPARMEALRREE